MKNIIPKILLVILTVFSFHWRKVAKGSYDSLSGNAPAFDASGTNFTHAYPGLSASSEVTNKAASNISGTCQFRVIDLNYIAGTISIGKFSSKLITL